MISFVLKISIAFLLFENGKYVTTTNQEESYLLNTPLGGIKGSVIISRLGRRIISFRGIRFAKAPIGQFRFKPPRPARRWEGVYDATSDGHACAQPNNFSVTSEDCLFLNVYTTTLPSGQENVKQPVIVSIHGGNFITGSGGSQWLGPQYLLDHDIVLVTFNYRLGVFGFISTGDETAPGNNGFKDQVEALRWVKDNIEYFGGNPDRVTIAGNDAGSISVGLHIVSPMSKGLFHRAILSSGTPTAQWKIKSNQLNLVQRQANALNCRSLRIKDIVECLKNKSTADLTYSLFNLYEFGSDPSLLWTPVIEPDFGQERFLIEDPNESLISGNYSKVPIMLGYTELEYIWKIFDFRMDRTLLNEMNKKFDFIAPISFLFEHDVDRSEEISSALHKFYFNNTIINEPNLDKLGHLYSDSLTIFGTHRFAELVAANNGYPVYYYKFCYKGVYSYFYLPRRSDSIPIGPVHSDDLIYIFHRADKFPLIEENDPSVKTVFKMTKLWSDFARSGNPTPERNYELNNAIWIPFTPSNKKYMIIKCHLNMENFSEDQNEWYRFWNTLFPLNKTTRNEY